MTEPAALPVPPLRLRRVRLHGVGPDGARFDPLDLDFSTRDGAASRVLLSLTNTGGKSTLITLISSLVVPAARAQVGGKNLGDYILTGDTSHIVCEWEDAATGLRTVTGTVMEWKDGRRQPPYKQRSVTNLHRAWYLFRSGNTLPGIDDLPFLVDGRRATFATYLDTLADLLGQYPDTRWVHTRVQQEWTQALLDKTSIDPVLFSYQMRMNDSETGAERLLESFDSPDNVVRFFIAALNNDRDIVDFTSKLADYAKLAAERPNLQSINDFCTAIGPTVDQIAARASAADEAAAAAIRARTNGDEFAGTALTRMKNDRAELQQQQQEVIAAAEAAVAARRDYGQISDIRLQLTLESARAQVETASADLRQRTDEARQAHAESAAWEAVNAILEVDAARVRRDAAQAAYEAADAGLGPMRSQVEKAAADLAGRLAGLANEALSVAEAADARAALVAEEERQAATASKDAAKRCAAARHRIDEVDKTVRAYESAARAARDAGWLMSGETPGQCVRRWQDKRGEANNCAEEQDDLAGVADQARQDADAAKDILDAELNKLRTRSDGARSRLNAFDEDLDRVAVLPGIEHLLGGPARTSSEIRRAKPLADNAAHAADKRAANHQSVADAAREELSYLDQTGTAATGPDVIAIVTALDERRIGAVTGLQWIENNIPDSDIRREFIAKHPEIAGGVIVTDPSRLAEADTFLADLKPRTRTPITVVANPAVIHTADLADVARFVVVPHRATWDRQWAQAARSEYEQTSVREGDAAARARVDAAAHRATSAACTGFLQRWADTRREELAADVETCQQAVEAAERQHGELIAERDRQRDIAVQARRAAEAARKEAARAGDRVRDAQLLEQQAGPADQAAQERPQLEADRHVAEEEELAADAAQERARAQHAACSEEAAESRSNAGVCRRELSQLGVEDTAVDPGGNLDVLRIQWQALRRDLEAAERGMTEAGNLDRAREALSDTQQRRDSRYEPEALERARALADLAAASSSDWLAGTQRRARDTARDREREQLAAEQRKMDAEKALRTARPADRLNHVDLGNFPEWRPSSPADIPVLMRRLEERNTELRDRRDAADQAERDAEELRAALADDVDGFENIVQMWVGEPAANQPAFTGRKRDAQEAMRKLIEAQRSADTAERETRDRLSDAVGGARAAANDPRWRELEAALVLRIRGLEESQLVGEAETLATRIRALAASAAGDLEAMDTHRAILRESLVAMCREQRRLLREVSSSSRLPPGLGQISGQPAIKIRFEDAVDDEVRARLGERIDGWSVEIAANPKRASSAEVRVRWLADAVRDTVLDRSRAGAFSIDILKPRIDGQVMYCPPDRIREEFSGGQVLTLAVLVYCALSRVRSSHRTGGARPPGTLLLDNPFGAASAETLIQMQHGLAAHSGIQLICATGLNDANVDKAFTGGGSVIVKLRNDGDLRRNLSFLRLRARTVDGRDLIPALTDGRPTDAPQNWVDSTKYEIRS
jgi:hypothetical protein